MPIENLLRFMDMVMPVIASQIILSIRYFIKATIDTNTNDLSMHLGIFYAFDNDGEKNQIIILIAWISPTHFHK